jgi:hypothetical protein
MGTTNVGEVFILFGGGPLTSGTNHQDLVTTIAGVSGTNITLAVVSSNTSPAATATYGKNNSAPFQNAISACVSNSLLYVPAGNYLMVTPQALSTTFTMANECVVYPAFVFTNAGITFAGAGPASTILTGCGGWSIKGSYGYRGAICFCQGPVRWNPAPLVISNMTFDGGVAIGNTSNHNYPMSTIDGSGWDMTTRAVADEVGNGPPFFANRIFNNVIFQHWRGEILHSDTSYWSGNDLVTNCQFLDFNADGYNFNYSHNITGCLFSNGFSMEEFDEFYNSNTCYFSNNVVTNNTGTGLSVNGAVTNRPGTNTPSYYIQNNHFTTAANFNAIQTASGVNIVITGNTFYSPTGTGIALGTAGQQGNAPNSNIVITLNNFKGVYIPFAVEGAQGANQVENVWLSNNVATGCGVQNGVVQVAALGYGWSTNVFFYSNNFSGIISSGIGGFNLQGQWYYDDLSNIRPYYETVGISGSNNVTYAQGGRQSLYCSGTGASYYLDDSSPALIPPAAAMVVSNCSTGASASLYTSTVSPGAPIAMTNGQALTVEWTNGGWQMAGVPPLPPTDLHVVAGQ